MKRIIFSAIVISSSLLLAGPAIAEKENDTVAQSLLALPLEELVNVKITTASKKSEKAEEAPATVYVITSQDIRTRGYSTLTDVLRDLPGMETIEHSFSEQGTLVPVRGVVGNNKIVVLVNGVRINPPGGEDVMLRSDMSVRMAKQIEVIYGPGSTLYGQDAISAVINIITKKAGDDASKGEALGSLGNHEYKEGFLSFMDTVNPEAEDPVKVSAYLDWVDSGLSNLSTEYTDWWQSYQEVAQQTGQDGSIKRWDNGKNAMLRLENDSSSFQAWYRDSSRSSSEGGFAPVLQYVNEAKWHDNSLVLEGKNKFELSKTLALNSSLTYNRYEIDPETRYVFPVGNTLNFNDYKYGLGTGTSLEESFDYTPNEDFHLIGGVVISAYDIIPKATIPGGADTDADIVSQAGSFVYYTEKGNPNSRQEVARATDLNYENYGAYLEGDFKVLDPLTVIAGARVDSNTRYDKKPFSPRAAVVYTNLENSFTLKYIFSKAYVSPAPYYGYNVFDNGRALNISNPDLEPERATSNEVSFSWNNEQWLFNADAYYNKQNNLLLVGDLALPQNVIQDVVYMDEAGTQERVLTHSVNGGETTSTGFDLFTRFGGKLLSMWASYSYVDSNTELGDLKTGLPQISNNNVRLGVTWKILENLSFTPSLVWRSTPANVTNKDGLDSELDSPYELNANILYTPVENWDVFLTMRNLTDNRYALKGNFTPTPQDGFSFRAGVRYTF